MLYGYARVSTDGQSLASQQAELHAASCVKVYAEKISGARSDRPELAKVLKRLETGDVLMVTRLDRLKVPNSVGLRARVRASWGLSGWRGNVRIADSIKKGPPGREREEAAFPIRMRDKPTVSPSGRSFATSTRVGRFPAEISSPTTKTP